MPGVGPPRYDWALMAADHNPSSHPASTHASATERHWAHRASWLRAAVLGADDGIVSTASLILGVIAAHGHRNAILTAGFAGLVAGALSMAAGEYVSVSSQLDAERADLAREADELEQFPDAEFLELMRIYERRGLSPRLAREVATELSAGNQLEVHARDELGLNVNALAAPITAAWVSALAFAIGGGIPILSYFAFASTSASVAIAGFALLALVVLGGVGARVGGAPRVRAAVRVFVGGGLAMLATTLIGRAIGAAI
jgi:VIT1/CCC1 family predicted Fe2+/Mn2+ transporter